MLTPVLGLVYVGWHVWVLLPWAGVWKAIVIAAGVASFALLFYDVSGRLDGLPMPLARTLYDIGTSSIIVLLYLAMLFVILDLGRLCGIVPRSWLYDNGWAAVGVTAVMLAIFAYGNWHYRHKERVELAIASRKPLPRTYKVVMASDLHLGYGNGRKTLAQWVELINREEPDLILIAGDIVDLSLRALREDNIAEEMRRLKAPIYACLGNHEYYGGEAEAMEFYQAAGIHLLRDEAAEVDGALVVIGRDDETNRRRKPLDMLMSQVDTTKFVIVLDHQPHHLERAERAGVDFQLSGHTHHGQVWPGSWMTEWMYECAWGSHQRGQTQYYVSSGLGIWGGKYRIGTQSEYVVASIR